MSCFVTYMPIYENCFLLSVCVFLYRLPWVFVETPEISLPFFVCITTFIHIRSERAVFRATTHLDKLIVAQLPPYTGSAWDLMRQVPLRDMLSFVDEFPGFYRATSPPPPYSVPLPPYPRDYSLITPPLPPAPQYSPESPVTNGYSTGLYTFLPTPTVNQKG